MLPLLMTILVSAVLLGWNPDSWADEGLCTSFPVGSLSRVECERNARIRVEQGTRIQSPPATSFRVPETKGPQPQDLGTVLPGAGRTDYDREAGRRICDVYGVTGNEWSTCVSQVQQAPPCPRPAHIGETATWEGCVESEVRRTQQRISEEEQRIAEQRRQAELEERKVRALEQSARTLPPTCTTFQVSPGVSRTICGGGLSGVQLPPDTRRVTGEQERLRAIEESTRAAQEQARAEQQRALAERDKARAAWQKALAEQERARVEQQKALQEQQRAQDALRRAQSDRVGTLDNLGRPVSPRQQRQEQRQMCGPSSSVWMPDTCPSLSPLSPLSR
jgi:hypothetical protein